MDLGFFAANTQTLTLVPNSACLSRHRYGIRRDSFVGGGGAYSTAHDLLRPPGAGRVLLRRSISRSPRPQRSRSGRFVVAATLDSSAVVVVVAVTTVSAISIAYFSHLFRRNECKKESVLKIQTFLSLGLSRLGGSIVDQIIGGWFSDKAPVVRRSEDLVVASTGDKVVANVDEEDRVRFRESLIVHHSSLSEVSSVELAAPAVAATGVSVITADREDYVAPRELEGGAVLESSTAIMFAEEMSELALESGRGCGSQDGEADATMKSATAVPVNGKSVDKENLRSISDLLDGPVREDLYTFSGGNHLALDSSLSVRGVNGVPSLASSPTDDRYLQLKAKTVHKEAENLTNGSLQTAEHGERKVPLLHRDGISVGTHTKSSRSRQSQRAEDGKHPNKDKLAKQSQLPHPNGVQSNQSDHTQTQLLSSYNNCLKAGRLSECVNLLEQLEEQGMLDMNKIYHTKFFKICKSQNAVKEAFCFFKLIPNPTMSTFNMLMSVCASSQDADGAFQVFQLVQQNGLEADCKLYTTLISTCGKSGKVDAMFEVFHQMTNTGIEPNVHTYGALIDGCARVGQVAKAFGAYGILRSKNVEPDRVVFNALINACGQSGAVDRAFDVLAEMKTERRPIDPDHITVGALMRACSEAGQVGRAQEVYKMIRQYNIKGTPEVYTIAVNSCSQTGDWEFARRIYDDMIANGVVPDEVFLSALIDVAGHASKLDAAFEVLREAGKQGKAGKRGIKLGIVPYSSLMGACSNSKSWQMALELFEDIKSMGLKPTVPTLNALITALCNGDQLPKAIDMLSEMKSFGLFPNTITYSMLLVAGERMDDLETGLMLLSQAKVDGVTPSLVMYKCIIGMCLRRFEKASISGESVLSFNLGRPQIDNKWTSLVIKIYREAIAAGHTPTMEVVSQVLACLQFPCDASLKTRLIENLGISVNPSKSSNFCSLLDGFGEYDSRALSLLEEAASLGIVPCVSLKASPVVVDFKDLQVHVAEVYLLATLKGLKYRFAAGAKVPHINIFLPIEKTIVATPKGEKTINIASRIGHSMGSMLRRLGISYRGNESYGKVIINGKSLRKWMQPKLDSPFNKKPEEFGSSLSRIGKVIKNQRRSIRTGHLSLD